MIKFKRGVIKVMSSGLNVEDILEILRKHKKELEEKYAVKKIGVFGSFAKGSFSNESDVDFYVEFNMEELTFDKFIALSEFLEKLTRRKVDIITQGGLKTIRIPYIKENIERNIIYA